MKTLTILLIGIVLVGCAVQKPTFITYKFKPQDTVVDGWNYEVMVIDSLTKNTGYYYATSVNVGTYGRHRIINDLNTYKYPSR